MALYRHALPQLDGGFYLTDGGLETTLIFHDGLEVPEFAAFHLLGTPEGLAALHRYFHAYAKIANRFAAGLVLESPTWRASADWGNRLGYTSASLTQANRKAIQLLEEIRAEYDSRETPVVISGCLGPRGDGYVADCVMSPQQAEDYHREQIDVFASSAADMVGALTMNYADEATGMARAARRAGMPIVISFTVETDGKLPTGQPLKNAIEEVDQMTAGYPSYYMINCAHPTHFEQVLLDSGTWLERIRGVRANASRKSHAALNESAEIDMGDPVELGAQYAVLRKQLARLNVMGGCCGTDHRHIEQIALACRPFFQTKK